MWAIVACIAFMIVAGASRGKPGRGVADTALLVIVFGIIAILDFIIGRFVETGDAGIIVAVAFAAGFALDSLYGLLAPERQKRRDKQLRRLMKRRT